MNSHQLNFSTNDPQLQLVQRALNYATRQGDEELCQMAIEFLEAYGPVTKKEVTMEVTPINGINKPSFWKRVRKGIGR